MLAQSLSLALLAFLAIGLPLWSFTDLATALHGGTLAMLPALCFAIWHQGTVIVAESRRALNRASLYRTQPVLDVLPPPATVETAETPPLPPPEPARSLIYNHGGKRERMTLMPTDSRLVYFLDACIKISAPDKRVFPTVRSLRDYGGVPYDEYDACLTMLGEAVDRKSKPASCRRYTLGQLRDMAAGLDVR